MITPRSLSKDTAKLFLSIITFCAFSSVIAQTIITVAGNGVAGFSGDGGLATSAQLDLAFGVAFDSQGNMYIADFLNARIRRVTPGGIISTFAGTGVPGYNGDGGSAT